MKCRSDIFGSGKTGNIVGVKGFDGEYYLRKYVKHVKDKKSINQQIQRKKFSLLVENLSIFSYWAKEMVNTNGKRSAYAELLKMNFNNVNNIIDGSFPNYRFDWRFIKIAKGKTPLPNFVDCTVVNNNELHFDWDNSSDETVSRSDDQVCIAIVCPRLKTYYIKLYVQSRDSGSYDFVTPAFWAGHVVFVYFAMKCVDEKTDKSPSDSLFLGSFSVS